MHIYTKDFQIKRSSAPFISLQQGDVVLVPRHSAGDDYMGGDSCRATVEPVLGRKGRDRGEHTAILIERS